MFENTPSDRVQLVGLGQLLSPANCMICGNGTCEEGYAHLGVFLEFVGEAYLCRTCVVQIAELFRCLTPEEAHSLREDAAELAAKNVAYQEELRITNERLAAFDSLVQHAAAINPVTSDGTVNGGTEAEPGNGSTDGVDAQTSGKSDSAKSTADEPVKGGEPAGTNRSKPRHDPIPERIIPSI